VLGLAAMGGLCLVLPGFGLGDVKLVALLGLLTGVTTGFSALAVAMIAGGVAALFLLLFRRAGRGYRSPPPTDPTVRLAVSPAWSGCRPRWSHAHTRE
jgi:Flp pilus assembly protein protease CpaA